MQLLLTQNHDACITARQLYVIVIITNYIKEGKEGAIFIQSLILR